MEGQGSETRNEAASTQKQPRRADRYFDAKVNEAGRFL